MLCRIDRKTLRARVRVFAPGLESECLQPCFYPPKNWIVERHKLHMTSMVVNGRGVWLHEPGGRWTRLDPVTLAVKATGTSGP